MLVFDVLLKETSLNGETGETKIELFFFHAQKDSNLRHPGASVIKIY